MRYRYHVEWVTETVDENGDIIDTDIGSKYCPAGDNEQVACRRVEEDHDGSGPAPGATYAYAYVTDGVISEEFDDGTRVPQSIRREVERAHKAR